MSKRTRFVAAACALVGLVPSHAALAQQRDFPIAATATSEDRYPARVLAWPQGVTSMADVTYSTLPGYRPMILDVYLPPREMGPRPLVLYVHGGGWVGGNTRHSGALANFPGALAALAAEGFVVASVEYRLAREAQFPAQLQDVRAALRYLEGNAAHYGIDPQRTGIWGGSAGGHLSALAALSCGATSLDPAGIAAEAGSECVQAAVIWYGVFDFADAGCDQRRRPIRRSRRCSAAHGACRPEDYAPASPVSYIDAQDPPMLLIHGEEDRVVPVAQSRLAEERLRAAGVAVDSIYIPAVDHSFLGATPEVTREATLRAVNATFDFFHATAGRSRRMKRLAFCLRRSSAGRGSGRGSTGCGGWRADRGQGYGRRRDRLVRRALRRAAAARTALARAATGRTVAGGAARGSLRADVPATVAGADDEPLFRQ